MADFIFSLDDIKEYIETEIPDTIKPELLKMLDVTDTDEAGIDRIGEKFLAEHLAQSKDGHMSRIIDISGINDISRINDKPKSKIDSVGISQQMGTGWLMLKKELYKCFCTESGKNTATKIKVFITALIPILAEKLGFSAPEVKAAITAGIILIGDMGLNKFCTVNKCLEDQK